MIAAAAVSVAMASAASASEVVYNNIPAAKPANVVSEAFEATTTGEFGGIVKLAGTARKNPKVSVLMSSWGCESGRWYEFSCKTFGGKFEVPIAFSVYTVGAGNQPGVKIAAGSKTFKIPYRPSANTTKCTGANTGAWFSKGQCYNGKAVKITLPLKAASLPDEVIVSIAFNTTHYGYHPIGEAAPCYTTSEGCGYDALNVGVEDGFEPPTEGPSVGTQPLPEAAYLFGASEYPYECAPKSPDGVFRLDACGWKEFQPLISVSAS